MNELDKAYWISPKGKIFKSEKHIDDVIRNPKAFGYTIDEIKKIYFQFKEPLGSEGKAREHIILELIKQGWVRIRKYSRPDKWSINAYKLTLKVKDYLQYWAEEMIKQGEGWYVDVIIDLKDNKKQTTLIAIKQDFLCEEGYKRYKSMFVDKI